MNLQPFVDEVREQLLTAAATDGPDFSAATERLSVVLDAAVRLALLDAISAAADEITLEMAPGSVEVRLRGRDPEFTVTPAAETQSTNATLPAVTRGNEIADGGAARITLRLSEGLKERVEAKAGREGLSVNTWVVRTLAAATDSDRTPPPPPASGHAFTGWVR